MQLAFALQQPHFLPAAAQSSQVAASFETAHPPPVLLGLIFLLVFSNLNLISLVSVDTHLSSAHCISVGLHCLSWWLFSALIPALQLNNAPSAEGTTQCHLFVPLAGQQTGVMGWLCSAELAYNSKWTIAQNLLVFLLKLIMPRR